MPSLYESVLLILVLLAGVGLYLAWPWVSKPQAKAQRSRRISGETSALEERHQQIIVALRDLDFDHRLAKVTDEDYAAARALLVAEGADILRALDAEQAVSQSARARRSAGSRAAATAPGAAPAQDLEAEIAARRKRKADVRAGIAQASRDCPQCGRSSTSDDVFCPRCGARLPEKKVPV